MSTAFRWIRGVVACALLLPLGCSGGRAPAAGSVVLYSGRSESLVAPLLERFTEQTGIDVQVKYGNSAQLALALQEEGERSPADVFWSQDAGALGVLSNAGLLSELPEGIIGRVPEAFRHAGKQWVGTSGRARVFAYSSQRVASDELPTSVFDLADAKWKGRVGWAPLNASFQSFVTAMRHSAGEEETERWLTAMKANGAKAYPKNTAIIEAIAAGEVDIGLPNHYYLLRFKKTDPGFPVKQGFFAARDIGNLVNVAGVGILRRAGNRQQAEAFAAFLLSQGSQRYFVEEVFEYPVTKQGGSSPLLIPLDDLVDLAPLIDLSQLEDLPGTLELLRRVGLL